MTPSQALQYAMDLEYSFQIAKEGLELIRARKYPKSGGGLPAEMRDVFMVLSEKQARLTIFKAMNGIVGETFYNP